MSWSEAKSAGFRVVNGVLGAELIFFLVARDFNPCILFRSKTTVENPWYEKTSTTCGQSGFGNRRIERRHLAGHHRFHAAHDLANGEWLAAYLVQAFRIDQVSAAQDHAKLPEVHFRHQHVAEL